MGFRGKLMFNIGDHVKLKRSGEDRYSELAVGDIYAISSEKHWFYPNDWLVIRTPTYGRFGLSKNDTDWELVLKDWDEEKNERHKKCS